MVTQTVLPFKLGMTEDTITAQAGLVLFGEFLHALKLPGWLDEALPGPRSGAGYDPSQFVLPLVLMLQGGGRTLEDLRQVGLDEGLREVLGLEEVPSADALGDWLRRLGAGPGLAGLAAVHRKVLARALERERTRGFTLDIDATQIVAEKKSAKYTYKGELGYMPMVGTLAEVGLVVGEAFREGNESPHAGNLEFIRQCAAQMPSGKHIAHVRSDSAAYQAEIFNECESKGRTFAIAAPLDVAVLATIAAIPEEAWRPYRNGRIAETVHTMDETHKAFRLVVVRRPVQRDLFGAEDPRERYKAIASNRIESAEETLAWYGQRGECSENRIKELKIGFGMERMPCGGFDANAVFFRIGVLAYNLFAMFKRMVLPIGWRKHQVQTLRWRLYQTAGKIVRHAGALILKVASWMFNLFEEVRARCRELACA
ncbi:MAG: IS1380 family transposase [SAR324 cluster bacterium]|nr:IS1380 family transposase [SAR324 cluster bacterium]